MKKNRLLILISAVFLSALLVIGGVVLYFAVKDGKIKGRNGKSGTDVRSETTADPDEPDVPEEDDIREQCPYVLSGFCEWSFYPSKNLLGFAAFARDDIDGYKTDIFVFNCSRSKYRDIIGNTDYLMTCAKHGEFVPDESDISTNGDYCYVKLKYDSRIPLLYVYFSAEHESISVYPGDQPKLNYYSFVDYVSTNKSQSFNEAEGKWDEVSETKDKYEEPKTDIPYVSWDELQVVRGAYEPCTLPGGATIEIWEYRYQSYDTYNIYDEIEVPRHVEFTIGVYSNSDDGFASLDGYDLDIGNAEIKLYKKSGSGYVDITPGDFVTNVYSESEWQIYATVSSTSLGELNEGDFRLEVGGYDVDFELKVQGFEVW